MAISVIAVILLFMATIAASEFYEYNRTWRFGLYQVSRVFFVATLFFYLRKLLESGYLTTLTSWRFYFKVFILLILGASITALLSYYSSTQFYDHVLSGLERKESSFIPFMFDSTRFSFDQEDASLVHFIGHAYFFFQGLCLIVIYFFLRRIYVMPSASAQLKRYLTPFKSELRAIVVFWFTITLLYVFSNLIRMQLSGIPYSFSSYFYTIPFLQAIILMVCSAINVLWLYASKDLRTLIQRIPLVVLLATILSFLLTLLATSYTSFGSDLQNIGFTVDQLFIILILSQVFSIVYFVFRRKAITRSGQLILDVEHSKSELSLLKSQINPHFLFNSLNTVYGLALNEESPKTAHAVQRLSEMMRFMLHENHAEKIPLQKEIDYLRNYIELQTLRISQKDHFQLEVDVAEGCQGEITPMVLIPFVENAFKHGVSFQKPSWVKIKLTCNAEEVHLNVQNSVHKHAEDPEKSKSGIGLENVRKRLGILYPEKHLFQIYETEDSFEANIKITLI